MKKKIGTSKSMKKYEMAGQVSSGPGPSGGGMVKKKSPGGSYVTKSTYDDQGNLLKEVERRTVKGLFTGAPKAKGVTFKVFSKGGIAGKPKMAKGGSVPFEALAKPFNKATYADKIAGAKKKNGGAVKSKKK